MIDDVSFPLAFVAGMLSFLSPCVLPLVPSYLSFITGISFKDLTVGLDRSRIRSATLAHAFSFAAGFSTVFILLGASSSALGKFFFHYMDFVRIIGGVLVIVFGLFISGLLKLDFLMKDKKFYFSTKPAGYLGTFLVGMTFAAGWSPCIGPILGAILVYAGSKGSALYGIQLLSVYSLGLAVPFILSALAINVFLSYSPRIAKHMKMLTAASGIILIVFGFLLLTDQIRVLGRIFPDIGLKF
jgi:cytochrome c-type biogenesis protein